MQIRKEPQTEASPRTALGSEGGLKGPDTESAPEQWRTAEDKLAKQKRSFDYIFKSGLAGGLAGCVAKSVVAPLDRVKILFQTSSPGYAQYSGNWTGLVSAISAIRHNEGFRGLFKGHSATLLQKFPYAAINFLTYEQIRAIIIPSHDKETPWRRLISGSIAGSVSILFTYPLDLIRVRLAVETNRSHRSLRYICRRIYHENEVLAHPNTIAATTVNTTSGITAWAYRRVFPLLGFTNFYRGFCPTLLGMLPYAGLSFSTHDIVSDWLRRPAFAPHTTISKPATKSALEGQSPTRSGRPQLLVGAELFAGALAGVVAQTVSYPFEVLRRRMQASSALEGSSRLGIARTCHKIWSEKGFRGFWVGLTIGYIKMVPMVATSFLVYERLKWAFGI